MELSKVPFDFDWIYYLEMNPDIAAYSFYNHEEGAKRHWLRHGREENRIYKRSQETLLSPSLKKEKLPQSPKFKFSIVIPTMWRSDALNQTLPLYEKSEYVKEIIIIDNDPLKKFNTSKYKKVKVYTKGTNIYVNPAWNWGASLSKYNVILANDDIVISDLDKILNLIATSDFDIVGASLSSLSPDIQIEEISQFPANSYGCFMYVKNYKAIPDQLKIWYGDTILFEESHKRGVIQNAGIFSQVSATINSDPNLFREDIGESDIREYEILKGKQKEAEQSSSVQEENS